MGNVKEIKHFLWRLRMILESCMAPYYKMTASNSDLVGSRFNTIVFITWATLRQTQLDFNNGIANEYGANKDYISII